jgi:ribonuclease BN (tRNA processing enzyme)
MDLHVLGSGTAVPHAARGAAGYAVRLPSGVLLLDTGPGSSRRWPSAGISTDEIRWIATTHRHVDHVSDLPAILFAWRVPGAPRPRHVTLLGPTGHARLLDALRGVWGDWIEARGYDRDLVELPPQGGTFHAEGFTLTAAPALHSTPAVSYRVDAGGRSLVYSGDSAPCDELVRLARDADLALFDCSVPDGTPVDGHMTAGQAGAVAAAARVRRLVLCHLYPQCDGVDVVAQARAAFGGPIEVAADGARYAV